MVILRDTREQAGFTFVNCGSDIEVRDATLPTADYSLLGYEAAVGVERKSLNDLVQSISNERARFIRELDRARGMSFAIVCEGSWDDLVNGRYRSKMHPGAAAATIAAIMARRSIPIHFAGSRQAAELFTASYLRQFLRGKLHEVEAMRDALGGNMPGQRLPVFPSLPG